METQAEILLGYWKIYDAIKNISTLRKICNMQYAEEIRGGYKFEFA